MAFVGTWKLSSCDGLDEFLTEIGIPEQFRKAMATGKDNLRLIFSLNGDKYHVKHEGGFKAFEYDFVDGGKHSEEVFGKSVEFSTKKESDTKFVHCGKDDTGEMHLVREIVGNQLHSTVTLKGGKHTLKLKWDKA